MQAPLNISSLRIMETSKNYGNITKAITSFDACLNRRGIPIEDDNNKFGKTIPKLIEAEITGIRNGIDDYVANTFHAVVLNETWITLDIQRIIEVVKDKELLIFVSTEKS